MRLSEAMRLGSMLRPQAYGTSDGPQGACALGAALDAIGKTTNRYSTAANHFPVLCGEAPHPISGETLRVLTIVRVLNDEHRWTREQIADWVETLEAVVIPSVDASDSDQGMAQRAGAVVAVLER